MGYGGRDWSQILDREKFLGTVLGGMGYFRILMGQNILGIESKILWAVPGYFTVMNYPCFEDGNNCGPVTEEYMDPFHNVASI
jgi:hypothetical protein